MGLQAQAPELSTLDLLATVAGTGSLGRAAQLHGISQPSASLRLQSLERRLGLTLLVRTPTGSRLTEEGELVVGWARPILEAAEELVVAVGALRDRRDGRVRVAASLTIADEMFPRWLLTLQQEQPSASVSLHVGNSAAVVDLVRGGEVAAGFIEGVSKPAGLRARTVGEDELVIVVEPQHRWARRRRPVEPFELNQVQLVMREQGSGTREVFEHALAAAGVSLRFGLELGSTAALKRAALLGEGPAVVSRLSVRDELAERRLVALPIHGIDLRRRLRAIWSPDRPPSGNVAVLLSVAIRQQRGLT